ASHPYRSKRLGQSRITSLVVAPCRNSPPIDRSSTRPTPYDPCAFLRTSDSHTRRETPWSSSTRMAARYIGARRTDPPSAWTAIGHGAQVRYDQFEPKREGRRTRQAPTPCPCLEEQPSSAQAMRPHRI